MHPTDLPASGAADGCPTETSHLTQHAMLISRLWPGASIRLIYCRLVPLYRYPQPYHLDCKIMSIVESVFARIREPSPIVRCHPETDSFYIVSSQHLPDSYNNRAQDAIRLADKIALEIWIPFFATEVAIAEGMEFVPPVQNRQGQLLYDIYQRVLDFMRAFLPDTIIFDRYHRPRWPAYLAKGYDTLFIISMIVARNFKFTSATLEHLGDVPTNTGCSDYTSHANNLFELAVLEVCRSSMSEIEDLVPQQPLTRIAIGTVIVDGTAGASQVHPTQPFHGVASAQLRPGPSRSPAINTVRWNAPHFPADQDLGIAPEASTSARDFQNSDSSSLRNADKRRKTTDGGFDEEGMQPPTKILRNQYFNRQQNKAARSRPVQNHAAPTGSSTFKSSAERAVAAMNHKLASGPALCTQVMMEFTRLTESIQVYCERSRLPNTSGIEGKRKADDQGSSSSLLQVATMARVEQPKTRHPLFQEAIKARAEQTKAPHPLTKAAIRARARCSLLSRIGDREIP